MPRPSKPNARASQPTNTPRPNAGTATDLDAYRRAAGAEPAAPARAEPTDGQRRERAKRERVEWGNLAGIPNLRIVDHWSDTNETYGDYHGTVVKLPKVGNAPAKNVLAITSSKTRAGRFLTKKEEAGAFDDLDGTEEVTLPVTVRARKSPDHPEGRPMVILRIGDTESEEGSA